MAIQQQLTNEETIAKLSEVAKSDRGDAFKVKVYRIRSAAEMPSQVLGLNNVTLAHIANPEQWLPKLIGGGPVFQLYVYHMSDPTGPVLGTSRLVFNIGGSPKDCDHQQTLDPRYDGPRDIYFPDAPRLGFPAASYNIPAPAGALSSVPQSQVPGGNLPGSGLQSLVDPLARERDLLAAERTAIAARERELNARLHQVEMEGLRRESDAKFAALEAKLSRPVEHARTTDFGGIIAAIGGMITPIVTAMMHSSGETKLQMLKIQQEQAAQHQALLSKLMERPGVDPQVKEAQDRLFSVLEKQMTTEGPNVKMLSSVTEAMGSVMGLYGDAIKTLTDLQGGEKEPVGMLVVKELVKGINAVAQGVTASASGRRIPQQRALPNGGRPAPAQVQAQPGFAGAPPVAAPATNGNPQVVDEIEAAIRKLTIPTQVARMFVEALNDPYLNAELDKYGRDPLKLFQARLGKWAGEHQTHMQYVQVLAAELDRALRAANIQFDPDPPAPTEPEPAADDTDENEVDDGEEGEEDEGDEGEEEEGEGAGDEETVETTQA